MMIIPWKTRGFTPQTYRFHEQNISFEDLSKQIAVISVDFFIDYSEESPTDNLATLSPFIIDVDVDTEIAQIRIEYDLWKDAEIYLVDSSKICHPTGQKLRRMTFVI